MKLYLGADHGGFMLKEKIKLFLKKKGHSFEDMGNKKFVKTDDYPDYGYKVAKKVAREKEAAANKVRMVSSSKKEEEAKGILFCGSAEGICIAANKVKGIRAVAVWSARDAKLSRKHNDANILCLSGWHLAPKKAEKIIIAWLKTEFIKEPRHIRRINKIKKIENA